MRVPFSLKSHLQHYFLTYIATAVSLYVFFFVDQIQRIWYQSPPNRSGIIITLGYGLFMAFTILYCVLAMVEVIFKTSQFPLLSWIGRFPLIKKVWLAGRFISFDWILAMIRRWPKMRWPTGILGTTIGAILLFFGPQADASPFAWYPLMGTVVHTSGLVMLLIGVWFLAKQIRIGRLTLFGQRPFFGLFTVQLIRVLTWFVETVLVTELFWLLASNAGLTNDLLTNRLSTIWTCFIYFTIVIILASVIDQWAMKSPWPVRLLALLLVAFFFWRDKAATVDRDDYQRHQTVTRTVTRDDSQKKLMSFLNEKVDAIKGDDGPVVILAASGGGSRAAIFTALVLETLQRTPINGSFNAGKSPVEGRTWADNVILVSSVSGGSLATAYYVQRRPDWPTPIPDLKQSTKSELTNRILVQIRDELAVYLDNLRDPDPTHANHKLFEQMREFWKLVASEDTLKAPGDYAPPDTKMRDALAACHVVNIDSTTEEAVRQLKCWIQTFLYYWEREANPTAHVETRPDNHWVLQSPYFDDMCTDFMAPIMRGLMSPRLDRGDALGRFWTERFRWHDSSNFEGYAKTGQQPSYEKYHPAVLFNATDVRDGKRLVTAFPPNLQDFWKPVYKKNPPVRLTTMSEFDVNQCQSLSRAVRMSSNFPFGFRVLEFQAPPTDKKEPLHVLDGGVVDNTGLDTLYEAFRGFDFYDQLKDDEVRALDPKIYPPTMVPQTKRFLKSLRDRTVVLIEIDAGAKPSQDARGPLEAVTEPMSAMGNSAYLNSELNKQFYINEIRRILCRPPGKPDDCPTVMHFRFECNHYDPLQARPRNDVMTAWTLGPHDKANVIGRFAIELDKWIGQSKKLQYELNNSEQALSLLAKSQAILATLNDLNSNIAKRTNEDDKTQADLDRFKQEYEAVEKRYVQHGIEMTALQARLKPYAIPFASQFDAFNATAIRSLDDTVNRLKTKQVVISLKAKPAQTMMQKELPKYNPQREIDLKAAESQQNLGKNNSKGPTGN